MQLATFFFVIQKKHDNPQRIVTASSYFCELFKTSKKYIYLLKVQKRNFGNKQKNNEQQLTI